MDFKIESTKAGKNNIVFNNHKFREHYKLKTSKEITWRCLGRHCSASIRTDELKTIITSANEKHSGPHPITMRSLMSPRLDTVAVTSTPTSMKSTTLTTPQKNSLSPSDIDSSPSLGSHSTLQQPHLLSSLSPTESVENSLLLENSKLKAQIIDLNEQIKCLLDHSIENDTRLLQYTSNVFVTKTPQPKVIFSASTTADFGVQCNFPVKKINTSIETQTEALPLCLSIETQTVNTNCPTNVLPKHFKTGNMKQTLNLSNCNCDERGDVCDNVIQSYFDFISKDIKNQNILFIPPSLIHWLKFTPDKELILDNFADVCDSKI
jgi:hypothetical protein